jgi:transposase-like protein DUF772
MGLSSWKSSDGSWRPFYSSIGRPSIDPELMIRMLLIGYCFGIRSERRFCEEVHLNLAYRWFCRLGLDGAVPDHWRHTNAPLACWVNCSFYKPRLRIFLRRSRSLSWHS